MRKVTMVTEIESEIVFCINMGSFLLSQVTAGHEIESEVGLCNKNGNPTSLSTSQPTHDLAH